MNVHPGIFLIGLAGSGKTTLGKAVARQLNLKFIDLDDEIEKRSGATIPEIFSHQGEGNFRILEKETLHEIVGQDDNYVMATGGGTPCFHFNMDTMNDHGITVYLDVNPGDLALRIMDEGVENRPVFKSYDQQDLIQEIRDLKERRASFYEEAKIVIRDNQITEELIISYLKGSGFLEIES